MIFVLFLFIFAQESVSERESFGWQAAILKNGEFHCGATLLSPYTAVTAAHCVPGEAYEYGFVAGSTDFKSKKAERRYLDGIIKYHYFFDKASSYAHDIAVLTWTKALSNVTGTGIEFLAMQKEEEEQQQPTDCFVTGWGSQSGIGKVQPRNFLKTPVEHVPAINCKTKDQLILPNHVCSRYQQIGESCMSDWGGPLVCRFGETLKLVGVASRGDQNCNNSRRTVYTSVPAFREWLIIKGMRKEFDVRKELEWGEIMSNMEF